MDGLLGNILLKWMIWGTPIYGTGQRPNCWLLLGPTPAAKALQLQGNATTFLRSALTPLDQYRWASWGLYCVALHGFIKLQQHGKNDQDRTHGFGKSSNAVPHRLDMTIVQQKGGFRVGQKIPMNKSHESVLVRNLK